VCCVQDIERFASSLSTLYSNITKPIIDVILFYRNLVQQFGWGGAHDTSTPPIVVRLAHPPSLALSGPTTMILYFVLAGAVMTKLRAPFAWYASTQAKLEGIHSVISADSLPGFD
jgi:ATP-binding cassette subfamily D (ALD) protein 3